MSPARGERKVIPKLSWVEEQCSLCARWQSNLLSKGGWQGAVLSELGRQRDSPESRADMLRAFFLCSYLDVTAFSDSNKSSAEKSASVSGKDFVKEATPSANNKRKTCACDYNHVTNG
ncbi:Alpha-glucosidase [Clarias magur]|uniref:Alpha-glucosidase n=1 Tax=Clarias magur TaxID=1594786 RepID=A0A8J4TNE1_CLAMG|nr:Alpha-glucosidase [Clarias magur]